MYGIRGLTLFNEGTLWFEDFFKTLVKLKLDMPDACHLGVST